MPKRKFSSTKRRRNVRRRRVGRRRLTIRRGPRISGPVPNKNLVRLRYVTSVQIDPATGLAGDHVFSANNIHDPDFSGIGHQPYGHDTLQTLYDNYIVVGSKITAEFSMPGTTTSTYDAAVGISLEDDAVTTTLPQLWMEQPKSHWKTIGRADGGKPRAKVVKKFGCKKFFGVKNIGDVQDRYGAQFGTGPAEQAWYHLIVAPINTSDDIQSVNVLVTIEYMVLCTELKDLAQS